MTFTHAVSTDNYGPAKFIVDASAANGTHTTIASALTSASSGDTIFIRPGTYTEDLTLKAGVNLTAYGSDSSLNNTGNVKIIGKATFTAAGSVTISGIELQTNSDFFLAVTGSAASIVSLNNCYLNAVNNTGISFTSSNAAALISIYYCTGNLGTTGIGLFANTSAGTMNILWSSIGNSGSSLTASTVSAGVLNIYYSNVNFCITTSSTSAFGALLDIFNTTAINTTALTIGGSGTQQISQSNVDSGTASAISISATLFVNNTKIYSTNTNAITGAGTIEYAGLTFLPGSTYTVNTTTQTNCGIIQGLRAGNAPAAGMVGENLVSFQSTSVSLTTATAKTITSLTLTAGIWDVCIQAHFTGASGDAFSFVIGLSTATNAFTGVALGDTQAQTQLGTGFFKILTMNLAGMRVTLSASTTYYFVAQANFATSTMGCLGRLSATRVG